MAHQSPFRQQNFPARAFIHAALLAVFISGGLVWAAVTTTPIASPISSELVSGLLEEYHDYLLTKLKGQTLWFDNFFGDRRSEEDEQPSSFVRLRGVARFTEGKGLTFPVRLRVNLELPKVNRRLRLVIFGGNREEDRMTESDDTIDSSLKDTNDKNWTNLGALHDLQVPARPL